MEGREREGGAEAESLRVEVMRLKKDEKSFERMIEEHKRQEKELPWNVDTISKEGFSKVSLRGNDPHKLSDSWCSLMPSSSFLQSVFNFRPDEESDKEEVDTPSSFAEKYAEEIKHFGTKWP